MLTVWVDSPDVNSPEESTLRISRSQLDDWCVRKERYRAAPRRSAPRSFSVCTVFSKPFREGGSAFVSHLGSNGGGTSE